MIADLEKNLTKVNAEHVQVEADLVARKREIEPVEAKLQVSRMQVFSRCSQEML